MTCLQIFISERYYDIQELCRRKIKVNADDLCNDICEKLLEDRGKLTAICERDEIWFYVVRIINISAFSKTSRFYYKYKKHQEFERVDIDEIQVASKSIEEKEFRTEYRLNLLGLILQDLDWFDAELFRVYYHHEHSLKSLSDATEISKTTIQKSIARTKAYIHEEIQRLRGYNRSDY
jgi:predicted DNA-binding protein YlxM (UPF0122 family)